MKKAKSILLYIDQRARDAQGNLLVYFYLKKMGINIYLCNKRNFLHKYEYHKPDVVTFSDTGTYYADWCRHVAKKSKIVLMPQEGAIPHRQGTIDRYTLSHRNKPAFTREIGRVFLWGNKTAQWLLEEGIFTDKQVVVTGTPRFDCYRIHKNPQHNSSHAKGFRIGIANRGGGICANSKSVAEIVDESKDRDRGHLVYYT